MAGEMRSKDFKVTFTVDGKTEVVALTRVVGDLDSYTENLGRTLGATDVRLTDITQSQRELNSTVRASINETNRQNRAYDTIRTSLQNQLSLVGATEAEQVRLNAVNRLGAGATDAQRASIAALATQLASQQASSRAAIQSADNHRRTIAQLRAEFAHASASIGASANRQQELNAIQRLGANATVSQRLEVMALVRAHQALVAQNARTQGSFRGLRGQAQNLGWQMQDVAVQAQMGTSALVIMGQQGSQVLSGFGPWGAVAGAVVAVAAAIGGVVYRYYTGTKSAKELEAAQKAVNQVFDEGADSADKLSEEYAKLFVKNKALALLTATEAKHAALIQKKTANDKIKEMVQDNFQAQALMEKSTAAYYAQSDDIERANKRIIKSNKESAKELGLTVDQYQQLTDLSNRGAFGAVSDELIKIATSSDSYNKKLNPMVYQMAKLSQEAKDAIVHVKELNNIGNGTTKPSSSDITDDTTKAFDREYNSLVKQTETIQEQFMRRRDIIDDYVAYVGFTNQRAAIAYINLEDWKTAELKKETDKRLAEETAIAEKALKARNKMLDKIAKAQNKQNPNSAAKENDLYNENELYLQMQFEKAVADERLSDAKRINNLIEGEYDRHQNALADISRAQLVANLQATGQWLSDAGNIVSELSSIAKEGSAEAKVLFLATQAIAMANIIVNTQQAAIAAGARETPLTGLAGFLGSVAAINAMGAVSLGIVAGTTIAGAFDKGGVIPEGQYGAVSEYGDELVDGVLVKGKTGGTRVTSREDTQKLLNGEGGQVGGTTINQYITVSGAGDKALSAALKQSAMEGAEMGAKKAYNQVSNDFKTGRGIRKTLSKSIGG